MRIYIASSWKNQHAVELLTERLRAMGNEVLSFVENNYGEQVAHEATAKGKPMDFEQWVWCERGANSFEYDTTGAGKSDLVIYIGPSGCDAWAEVGIAWANKVPILALNAKGDQVGLMRRMALAWYDNYRTLLEQVQLIQSAKEAK